MAIQCLFRFADTANGLRVVHKSLNRLADGSGSHCVARILLPTSRSLSASCLSLFRPEQFAVETICVQLASSGVSRASAVVEHSPRALRS